MAVGAFVQNRERARPRRAARPDDRATMNCSDSFSLGGKPPSRKALQARQVHARACAQRVRRADACA